MMHMRRVRDVNPATLRTFGASSKASFLGLLDNVYTPETRRTFFEMLLAVADQRSVFSCDAVLNSLAGERLDLAVSARLPREGESYEHVLISLVDMSAAKRAQRDDAARSEQMERALRFSEMFVGILGHDLRNPLSAIMTAANLLEVRADSEKISKPVARILVSADRMERMITQLLDFTRIRLGRGIPLERKPLDLADACRAIIDEIGFVRGCPVLLDCEGDTCGDWDKDRLGQLLANLIANACQHGTEGMPVSVSVDGTHPDLVVLQVSNKGAVADEVLPVLFEPLRICGDRAERRHGSSGLGLGLFISQQIVIGHGGTIRVDSTAERGTFFTVELPRRLTGEREGAFSPIPPPTSASASHA